MTAAEIGEVVAAAVAVLTAAAAYIRARAAHKTAASAVAAQRRLATSITRPVQQRRVNGDR